MNKNVQDFIDKSEKQEFHSLEEMLAYAKENANVYDCHAPHLDKDLQPAYELLNKAECKNTDACGNCHQCDYMVDALSESGKIFMYSTQKLVCAYS